MKPCQTLTRILLTTVCCTTALACAGDDGQDEPIATGGGVPYVAEGASILTQQQTEVIGTPGVGQTAVSYSADLGDMITSKCSGCHDFWLSNDDEAYLKAFDLGEVIVNAVQGPFTVSTGDFELPIMPLGCGNGVGQGTCLSQDEVDLIAAWAASGFQM